LLLILDEAGTTRIAKNAALSPERVEAIIERIAGDVGHLPDNDEERALDLALGQAAVRTAVRRHAGQIETAAKKRKKGAGAEMFARI
jgi:hypothetical protein